VSELKIYGSVVLHQAGCDEAGRGCLAGPVVAAGVILPLDFDHDFLNDSKKVSPKKRNILRNLIFENAISWAIGVASVEEIDEINILNASFLAMHRAINALEKRPELLLIDGNRFKPYENIPHKCIIGGDAIYRSIAAASILAKTERDLIMEKLDVDYPSYNWKQNKGYPTFEHRLAIMKNGMTPHHRRSFSMGKQLRLDIL
jgi:ribonuclease HII